MATAINFATTPRVGAATVSTANTNRDGSGTVVTVFTAGSNGTRIDRIRVQATVTTTAGMVRLFLHDGTNFWPLEEVPVAAVTVSASVAGASRDVFFGDARPLNLPTGWSIRASTHNAEAQVITVYGADY
jgi:hypothetical protein